MTQISLRPWSEDDLHLLRRANTPEMTAHLNGPETEEQVLDRHARYLRLQETGESRMYVIVDGAEPVGSIGYWPVEWRGEDAFEAGWFVLPEAQGRGIGSAALALVLAEARRRPDRRRVLMACPSVENAASNGVCRRNGFTLADTLTETFRGADFTLNEWVLDLTAPER